MKTTSKLTGLLVMAGILVGCVDREAEARKAREDAEAAARAAAARREMEALPKTFQTPDYYKKNEPEKKPEAVPEGSKSTS